MTTQGLKIPPRYDSHMSQMTEGDQSVTRHGTRHAAMESGMVVQVRNEETTPSLVVAIVLVAAILSILNLYPVYLTSIGDL